MLKDNQSNLPTNMKILSLYGRSKKGKTLTLGILAKLLQRIGQFTNKAPRRKKEVCGVFSIYNAQGKEIKVGLTTKGDDDIALDYDFTLLGKCDLYVCASHLKGSTLTWLQNRTKNGYLLRLSKATVQEQGQMPNVAIITEQAINTWQAEKLFEIVISLL